MGVAAVRGRPAGYTLAEHRPAGHSQLRLGKPGKHADTRLVDEHEGG